MVPQSGLASNIQFMTTFPFIKPYLLPAVFDQPKIVKILCNSPLTFRFPKQALRQVISATPKAAPPSC